MIIGNTGIRFRTLRFGALIMALTMALGANARADLILYSVGSSSATGSNDSISNTSFSGSVTLSGLSSTTAELQAGSFFVAANSVSGTFPFSLSESFSVSSSSFNTVNTTVHLSGNITTSTFVDTLTFTNGTPTIISLSDGETLTVTPLALLPISRTSSGTSDYTLEASFALTPAVAVPEPSTAFVAGFGALSGIAYGSARKRRASRRQVEAGRTQPPE